MPVVSLYAALNVSEKAKQGQMFLLQEKLAAF